jgi:hypothetical protein
MLQTKAFSIYSLSRIKTFIPEACWAAYNNPFGMRSAFIPATAADAEDAPKQPPMPGVAPVS